MGYTVVSVSLKDGPNFDQAIIASCCLSRVRVLRDVTLADLVDQLRSNPLNPAFGSFRLDRYDCAVS
jgi:hypothetical protein